jgi:hypothetical protein
MQRRMLVFSVALGALMLGCSRTDPVSTDRAGTDVESAIRADASRLPTAFHPLAVGNRWRLHRDWALKVSGDYPPGLPLRGQDDYEFEQICEEVRGNASYIVEKQTWWDDEGGGGSWHVRYRQDASGLYQPDLCLCEPPQCSVAPQVPASASAHPYERLWERIAARLPDGANRAAVKASWDALYARIERARNPTSLARDRASRIFELTILKYPLYPGQSWFLRHDPEWFVQASVEAFEVVDLPVGRVPAYRIRIEVPHEPDDVFEILQWWGRCGLMRATMHVETEIVGEDGEPIGTLVWDEIQDVTDIDLVDLRPCTIEWP